MADREMVKVVWGEVLIAPVAFNNFKVGPFEMMMEVKEGETTTQAMDRGYATLAQFARKTYEGKLASFKEMYAGAKNAVR
jgi:hypothetical protein